MKLLGQFQTLYFFLTKRFCTHQKHQKHQKHKSTKTQPSKSTKRYKRTKIKNALKNICGEKVTYSLICVFVLFVGAKKRK